MNKDLKCNKLAGFLYGATEHGLCLDDAWSLLLTSKEGRGILREDYTYCVHIEGRVSADKALERKSKEYKRGYGLENTTVIDLLAQFIEYAHCEFNIPYEKIFAKMSIGEFREKFGSVLGNYDDKLIRGYLI